MRIASLETSFRQFARQYIDTLAEAAARRKKAIANWPFIRLVLHFLSRMASSSSTDSELGLGALLGLIAAPGAFSSFLLLDKYSSLLAYIRRQHVSDPYLVSVPDKYFFIVLSMAVTGIVTVLKWDKILPDRKDHLNLAPLPIRLTTILFANATALLIAAAIFAVDVNAVSTVLFPAFVTAANHMPFYVSLQFAAAHALCVFLASSFAYCAVLAVMGALIALLPPRLFRSWFSWVRGLMLVMFVAFALTGFAGSSLVRSFQNSPDSALRFLPPLWYLALYQSLQSRAGPALARLAKTGVEGVAIAFAVMAFSYLFSLRRTFSGIAEGSGKPPAWGLSSSVAKLLDWFSPAGAPFQQACHRFVIRGLLRNDGHCLAIGAAAGLGFVLAIETAADSLARATPLAGSVPLPSLLSPPLIVSYLLICGLRIAFDLPAALPANWVFRAVLMQTDIEAAQTARVARNVILSFLISFVIAPCLLCYWAVIGLRLAALHTVFVLALSLLLIDMLLFEFRRIPLTCPSPPFRNHLIVLCLLYLLGFIAFTTVAADLEHWMLREPWRFLAVCPAVAAVYWGIKRWLRENRESDLRLAFEAAAASAIVTLDLSNGQ